MKPVTNNVFSQDQIDEINNIINNTEIPDIPFDQNMGTGVCQALGRVQIGSIMNQLSQDTLDRVYGLVDTNLKMSHALYVEYNPKYGKPTLPPHFDGDTNDLILNYQLEANTQWDLGIGLDTYTLEDNSAVIFNGNTDIHWRVHKEFQEGEYVKMIFMRFNNPDSPSDYTHLPMDPSHEVFKEVKAYRNGLRDNG